MAYPGSLLIIDSLSTDTYQPKRLVIFQLALIKSTKLRVASHLLHYISITGASRGAINLAYRCSHVHNLSSSWDTSPSYGISTIHSTDIRQSETGSQRNGQFETADLA